MALSITALSDSYTSTTSGSATSASFTPPNNCLVVAFVAVAPQFAPGVPTNGSGWTASGGGLTWTNRIGTRDTAPGNWYSSVAIFTAPVTTGSSMTMTVPSIGNTDTIWASFRVNYVTGYNTSTPTGATASGVHLGNGAISITLSGAPASSSIVFAGIMDVPNSGTQTGITAGSGWTVQNAWENVNSIGIVEDATQYITGTTSTTVPWQAGVVGDTQYTQAAVALEILAAAGGETITVDKWYSEAGLLRPGHYRKNSLVAY